MEMDAANEMIEKIKTSQSKTDYYRHIKTGKIDNEYGFWQSDIDLSECVKLTESEKCDYLNS